jgi:hypothetical protein
LASQGGGIATTRQTKTKTVEIALETFGWHKTPKQIHRILTKYWRLEISLRTVEIVLRRHMREIEEAVPSHEQRAKPDENNFTGEV